MNGSKSNHDKYTILCEKAVRATSSKDYDLALTFLDKAIHLNDADPAALFLKASLLTELKKHQDAILLFDKLINAHPEEGDYWYGRGVAQENIDQYANAILSFDKAVECDPQKPHYWVDKAFTQFKFEKYDDTLETCNNAIAIHGKNAALWNFKGDSLYNLNRIDEGLIATNTALSIYPQFVDALHSKGSVLIDLNRPMDALTCLRKAYSLAPNNLMVMIELGISYDRVKDYEKSLHFNTRATKLYPDSFIAWTNKGVALNCLERFELAIEAFKSALSIDSGYSPSWNGLGNSYLGIDNYKKSLECYRISISINPKSVASYIGIGNVYGDLDDLPRSLLAFEKALSIDSTAPIAWVGRGYTLERQNRLEEATGSYDEAIRLDPSYCVPWLYMGTIHYKRADYVSASVSFNRFCRLADKYELRKRVGEILKLHGEHLNAPMFVLNMFNRFPELISNITYYNIYRDSYLSCKGTSTIIDLLSIDSERNHKYRWKYDRTMGLILYLLGDPLKAYEYFDLVDSKNDTDLMSQYYLIQSLIGFGHDYSGELDFAISQASTYLESKSKERTAQDYYSGMIFLLRDDFIHASVCFKNALDQNHTFLPAKYMLMYCYGNTERLNDCEELIDEILMTEKEILRLKDGASQYYIAHSDLLFSGDFQENNLIINAHRNEISEAILYINKWSDGFDRVYGSEIAFDIDDFIRSMRVEMSLKQKDYTGDYIPYLENVLIDHFTLIPGQEFQNDPDTLELKISVIAQNLAQEEKQRETNYLYYHTLINYYYYQKSLDGYCSALLHIYLIITRINQQKNVSIEEFVSESLKGLMTMAGTTVLLHDADLHMKLLYGAGVSPIIYYITKHIKDRVGTISRNNTVPSYAVYKNNLEDYVAILLENEDDHIHSIN